MRRYFFNVIEGDDVFPDANGEVYPNAKAAIAKAAVIASELAQDPEYRDCIVEVVDESGKKIASVPVRSQVQ